MSGGKTESWANGGKEVVITGRFGFGWDVDGESGGETDGGGGRYTQDRDRSVQLIK